MMIELVGWIGSALILIAYFLVSTKRIPVCSVWYPCLNGIGSVGIIINTFYKQAWPPLVLNVLWTLIAIWSLFALFHKSKFHSTRR
jgi:multidrug transporter EmrE-like cation transporter